MNRLITSVAHLSKHGRIHPLVWHVKMCASRIAKQHDTARFRTTTKLFLIQQSIGINTLPTDTHTHTVTTTGHFILVDLTFSATDYVKFPSSIHAVTVICSLAFSALTLLVGRQEGL